METKKAKQQIAIALDSHAGRGRFTVRGVAEEAARMVKYDSLSLSDKQDAMMGFLIDEVRKQMKGPLRDDMKEEYFSKLPEKYWPLVERLTKTICIAPGGGKDSYHVFTLYATRDDWELYLTMADIMAKRARSARNAGRNIRDLLDSEGALTLWQLMTGEQPKMISVR